MYRKILLNTVAQFGAKGLSVALSLLMVSLLTRYLGNEGYGNFTLVFTYISLFAVLSDMGFNQIIVREFSGKKEMSEFDKASILNSKLLLNIVSIVLPIVILPLFPYSDTLKGAIIIGSIAVAAGNMVSFGTSILQSQLKLEFVAMLDLLMKCVSVIAIYLFIQIHLSLYYIIIAVLIGNLAGLVWSFWLVRKHLAYKLYINFKLFKRLLILGIPVGISSFLAVLYFKVDTLMLSIMRSSAEVGIYGLSFKLFDNILMLWALYMASVFPLLSKFFIRSDKASFKKLVRSAIFMLMILSLFIMLFGYTFTPLIMRILGGSKFFSSMLPFKILVIALPFLFLNNIFYNIILSFGKTKYLIQPLIISLSVNILINLYAIPKYGYIGASYTTVITEILTSIVYFYILSTKFNDESEFLIGTK